MLFSFKKVKKEFQLKQASDNHSLLLPIRWFYVLFLSIFFTFNYFVKYLLKKNFWPLLYKFGGTLLQNLLDLS